MELLARSKDEKAVMKSKNGLRKIPVFVSSCGRLAGIHLFIPQRWRAGITQQEFVLLSFCWLAGKSTASDSHS
jgi:hypothetical protein